MNEILRVEGLSKTFRLSRKQQQIERTNRKEIIAVNDLSFTANKGEIFGLLGPNGAGKTTTLRMLATLIRPDSGDALLDGCSVVNQPEEVRGKIGFLTSELKLEDFFTPNYLFDFFSQLYGIAPEVISARKTQLFERFGINKFAEVKVANLSTGMKQKLSLVISNLVENAIKYNVDNGWVRITLNADHKFFYIRVADSGVGIPEDAKDKVFDRFYRVSKDGTVEGVICEAIPSNSGQNYYVKSGLHSGDEIVINGVQNLSNGMKVR